jgi:signal transduction histidine kinase
MNKKFIFSILVLMTVGFVGLIGVQAYWLNKAATLKERLFRASVNRALTSVAQRLEANEAQEALSRSLHSLQFARQTMNTQTSPKSPYHRKAASVNAPQIATPVKPASKLRSGDTANVVSSPLPNELNRTMSPMNPPNVPVPPPVITFQTNGQTVRLVLPDLALDGRTREGRENRDSLVARIRNKMTRRPFPDLLSLSNLAAISGGAAGKQSAMDAQMAGAEPQEQQFNEQRGEQGAQPTKRKRTLREMMERKELLDSQREALRQLRKAQEQLGRFGMSIRVGDSVMNVVSAQASANGFEMHVGGVSSARATSPRASSAARPHSSSGAPSGTASKALTYAVSGTTSEQHGLGNMNSNTSGNASSSEAFTKHDTVEKIIYRADLIEKALEDMTLRRRSICDRVNMDELEALLQRAFRENDITLGFNIGVQREQPDSLVLVKASPSAAGSQPAQMLRSSEFKTRLFPNDFTSEPYQLVVHFPEYKTASLFTFSPVLGSAGACMLLIVGCFGFTLLTLVKQKKLSDMKTDFINNMTHELKTPIATIAIASEALKDGDIRTNTSRVERFVGIIHDENKRLAGHVEKVLQAAQMERGELRLNTAPIDAHTVIATAAASIALQVEQKCGSITTNLNATQPSIEADEAHLTNVVFNLLDNATKYSPERPHIHITTRNTAQHFILCVEDNGIGMSKEAQKHIFEKFYRVPTGNVHDVKGFGLGLSYVKSIVEAHGGSVSVQSELGKGTCFEVLLPLVQPSEG